VTVSPVEQALLDRRAAADSAKWHRTRYARRVAILRNAVSISTVLSFGLRRRATSERL